jgi:hypothetical protein
MMGNWGVNNWSNMMGYGYGGGLWNWLPLLFIWELFWKGLALWKAARNDQRYWYIALLIFNTFGLLQILYLFVFAKEKLVIVREAKVVSKRKSTKK